MIYTALQAIQTIMQALQSGGSYVFGADGTNFQIGTSIFDHLGDMQLPAGTVHITGGDIKERVVYDSLNTHILVLVKDEISLEQTIWDDMEAIIESDLRTLMYLKGPVGFSRDNEAFNIFGFEFPVLAPYGAFRLDYRMSRSL